MNSDGLDANPLMNKDASSEVSRLKHKVSVIDGNEPLIEDLNWQP